MREYFPEPKSSRANIKVKLDLSIYVKKADLKKATRVNTSDFAKNTDSANLKSYVDKLDIDKLKTVPSVLNNLKGNVDKLDIWKLETIKLI